MGMRGNSYLLPRLHSANLPVGVRSRHQLLLDIFLGLMERGVYEVAVVVLPLMLITVEMQLPISLPHLRVESLKIQCRIFEVA
jgi:hypothetical protein